MCRELVVISCLEAKDIRRMMKDYGVGGEIDTIELRHSRMDHERDSRINIEQIDGQCLCNISTEQRKRVFEFIHAISVI